MRTTDESQDAGEAFEAGASEPAPSRMQTFIRDLAFQDVAAPIFHSYMLFRAFTALPGPHVAGARSWASMLFAITICTVILVRGRILPEGKFRALFYRLGIFFPMVVSYFELSELLPALQPHLLDMQLFHIDRALFGETPSLVMQRWNTRPVVEWIAFFYYSYFYLMIAMLIPALLFDKGKRLHELMIGAFVVCGGGHVIYTLVPGVGPYATIPFDAPLDGGFWWQQVQVTVSHAGAQLDIFPSLHTAYPTYFTLHAIGYRKTMPFKFVWPIIAFFALNMVTATMFLRWHWGIDVIAGLTLACTARMTAIHFAQRERGRAEDGDPRMPVWERFVR
jgi:hypothetical protein